MRARYAPPFEQNPFVRFCSRPVYVMSSHVQKFSNEFVRRAKLDPAAWESLIRERFELKTGRK